jgi:hypothetical protein
LGLALLGLDVVTSTSATWHLQFGLDVFQFSFLLLSSSSVFQFGFSSGRTIFKSPNNAKPCSLYKIRRRCEASAHGSYVFRGHQNPTT